MLQKNILNITVLFALINMSIILLLPNNLISLNAFENHGAISHINMLIILSGVCFSLWLGLTRFAGRTLDWFCLAFIFQIYLLREANFHESFSNLSLTQWKNYTYPDIPLDLKLVAACSLLLLFMCMSYLLARYTQEIIISLKKGQGWSVSFIIWAVCIISSQYIDRKIAVGDAHWKWTAVEEIIELGAAIFALSALIQFVSHYRNKYNNYFS